MQLAHFSHTCPGCSDRSLTAGPAVGVKGRGVSSEVGVRLATALVGELLPISPVSLPMDRRDAEWRLGGVGRIPDGAALLTLA